MDWLFPAFIVFMLYDFAFGIVGGLYKSGFIKGRDIGSIIHWGIRYGIMWLTIQALIFLRDNWIYIIISVFTIIIFAVLIGIMISKINYD
ncbi:hypothetical protein BK010_00395 [Tenericutes bacterium MO-XQ]|nr:hypothetical protein BK010_00395 [Tenericutes bacterium MO-XQ]